MCIHKRHILVHITMAAEDIQVLCFSIFFFARELLLPFDRANAYDDMLYLISDKNSYQSVWCGKIFPHHKFLQGLFVPARRRRQRRQSLFSPNQVRVG